MTNTELVLEKIKKLGFETGQILNLVKINEGLYKPEIALLIAKGLKYDELEYKFNMLEREYYKILEEHDKAQMENMELESEC